MNTRIQRMSEYVLQNNIYPPIVPVTFDEFDVHYPEAMKNAKQLREFMLAQTVRIDDWTELVGLLKFDGSVVGNVFQRNGHQNFNMAKEKYYLKPLNNLITFEWEHSNADFSHVLNVGIEGLMKEINVSMANHKEEPEKQYFLSALMTACNAIIDWAEKCAKACVAKAHEAQSPSRAEKLYKMAATLRRVPRLPAETFEEAVQSLYLCFHFLPDSLGLPDRYLLPFYRKGIADGSLTREHAKELLQELFTMIQGFTPNTSPNADKGGESHFAIGGYLPNHEDGFNELSALILESMMELPYFRPQVTLRWTKKTPHEVFLSVLKMEKNDAKKRIAFVNDEERIPVDMKFKGLTFEQACEYIMVGCNEPTYPGSMDLMGNNSNIARSLTNTLYHNTQEVVDCKTFDEFYEVYERSLFSDMAEVLEYIDLWNAVRAKDKNIISSLFMDTCIERGLSCTEGGCSRSSGGSSLMGYVVVIDSLSIIRQFVYDEKRISMGDFIEIMRNNWEGHEDLRQEILNSGKFHGNNDQAVTEVAVRLNRSVEKAFAGRVPIFARAAMCGTLTGYHPHYAFFGSLTPATPDGRKAGEAFGVGVGQYNGKDHEGITALLKSVADMNPTGIIGGASVFNLTLDSSFTDTDEKMEKMARLMETFFAMGGLHFQLNYLSAEELLDAKHHPERHKSLRVRVSGFSAYFTTLREEIQNDVIRRTMQKV